MKANELASSLHVVRRIARVKWLVILASLAAAVCTISHSARAQDWDLNSGDACSHIGGCSVNVTGGGGSYHGGGGGLGSGSTCDSACQARKAEGRDNAFNNAIGVKAYNLLKKAIQDYDKIYDKSRGCPNKKMANMASSWRDIWANRGNDPVPFEAWQWDEVTGDMLSCYAKSLPVGTAEWRTQYERAYGNYIRVLYPFYPDRSTTAEHTAWYAGDPDSGDVKRILWKLWTMQYNAGRKCPEPPKWNGTSDGCVGRTEVPHALDSGYVPLPTVDGSNWTLRNFDSSNAGNITIADKSNRPIDMNDMHLVKIMDGMTVETGKGTGARFTLPDTEHDIVLGTNSKVTFLGFTYDPNTLSAVMTMDNLRGVLRIVTSKISNALGMHSIEIRTPAEVVVAERGSNFEVCHGAFCSLGSGIGLEGTDGELWWCIYALDGDVQLTDADGTWTAQKGKTFCLNDHELDHPSSWSNSGPSLTFSDDWDMTPWDGRELQ